MNKTGWWDKQATGLDGDTTQSLEQFKNELLSNVCSDVKAAFNVDFQDFDPDKIEHIELSKAIIRSFLRYDSRSIRLVKSIAENIQKLSDYELKYCSLPYPIIHFNNDTSEIGKIHTDGQPYVEQFITTWTPLNDCFHKPLLIVDADEQQITPDVLLGEYLMWDGNTKHEGLLNLSGNIHVALVTKFTSNPLLNEQTATFDDLDKIDLGLFAEFDRSSLCSKFIDIYKQINEQTNKFVNIRPIELFENAIDVMWHWRLNDMERRKLSFMLTLFSQRMERSKRTLLFYMYSIICHPDNLLGLQKIMYYSYVEYGLEETERFVKYYLERYPSKQAVFAIRSTMTELSNVAMPEDLKLLNWTI